MKKIIICILATLLPIVASAYDAKIDGIYYNFSGTEATVTYDESKWSGSYTGDVTIPENVTYNGVTYNVTTIGYRAFQGCSNLTSVTIPNSVTTIDRYAFQGCSGLTEVTIPNSVTSIGNSAFMGCSGLPEVTIPNSVTSIGDYAFSDCYIYIGKFDNNSGLDAEINNYWGVRFVDSREDGFCISNGELLEYVGTEKTIIIPNSVTSIGDYAFSYCSSLTSITIPNGVTSIGNSAFANCSSLAEVTIPNSVIAIGDRAFSGCSSLKSISVESGNTVYDSRDNCNAIIETASSTLIAGCKNTVIPNSVTSIGDGAFSGCSSLRSVKIPNSVTSIGGNAFYDCSGLRSVIIPNSVTTIGDMAFSGCSSLKDVYCYAESVPSTSTGYFGPFSSSYISTYTLHVTEASISTYQTTEPWSGFGTIISLDGNLSGEFIEINETTFPDESFRNWLLSQSYGEDGMLTDTEILTTTTMYVYSYYGSSIQSLKGIEYFTELTSLSCTNHSLTTIDLSKNTKLTNLECYSNQISGEGMDALIASLPVVSNGTLRIHWYNNEGNEMSTAQAAAAKSKGWIPQAYTINEGSYNYSWVEYTGTDVDPSLIEKFPDAAFRNYLLSQSYGMDGVITDEEIATVTRIDVPYKKIKSLKGIEYFTALEMLDCGSNQLTDLDLSKNTKLTFLNCYSNQLTSLDLSKNTLLSDLDCSNNQLKILNLSGCKKLVEVGVGNNQLTTLDLSGCTELVEFVCHDNQLTSLNLSGCTSLDRLTCYNNQLKGTSMDALIASLPTVSIGTMRVLSRNEIYKMLGYEDGNGYSNEMTLEQVIAAKAKGWIPYYSIYGTSSSDWVEYIPNDPSGVGIAINETNFPDENFRNNLLSTSYGYDGVLTELEASLVNTMDVAYGTLQSLKGIEYFTELKSLNCGDNQIATMDLSKNTKLTSLDCHSNQLTSLDVSKCTELTRLECGYNQIATLDLSDNTKLNTVYCYGNNMATLDVSKCTELTRLECMENQLTTLDVSNMPMLVGLYCSENLLTSLDVSKSTLLQRLECYSNQLTSLDVSNNTALTNLECEDNQLTALDVSNNTMLKGLRIYKNQIKGKAMDILVAGLPMVDGRSMRAIYNEGEGNEMTRKQVYAAWEKGWIPERYGLIETDYGSYYSWEEYYGSDDDILRGDVNGDGEVNVGDLVSVSNYMAGDESVSEDAADVNQDGEVNVGDMVVISNIMSGNE